jgi:hypothetical protein
MGRKTKHTIIGAASTDPTRQHATIYHAMRGGNLYRSLDGMNWEIETGSSVPAVPEGTSRVTVIKQP